MAVFQLTSIRGEVQTIDEGVHLAAGVSYWHTGDFRLNEEHPPLVKLLAALPVVLARPHISYAIPSWQEGNQWAFARDLLYEQGNDADTLLILGRLPMIALSLTLGFVLYLWGRRLGGDLAGILTLGWYIFDPNFLAHGRYITTDVSVTLAYAATLYALLRLLERWTWKRALGFAVLFGLAQVTKFSALFLYAIILLVPAVWHIGKLPIKKLLQRTAAVFGLAVAGALVAILLIYGGQVQKGANDPWITAQYQERDAILADNQLSQQPPTIQRVIRLTDPATPTGRLVRKFTLETWIPSWSYFKGVVLVLNHDLWGHLAYLNGRHSNVGWWWYFPLAIAVKTPLATLIMLSLALVALARPSTRRHLLQQRGISILLGACVLYLVWSLTSKLNLGVRHVFPFYSAVFVLVGIFLASVLRAGKPWLRLAVGGIVGLYVTSSILAYPTYTAYFSEIVGGKPNGPRYLVDSNIDWGQDGKRLRAYLEKHAIPYVCMSYFGQANLAYYGLDTRYLPSENDPHAPKDIQCVVAISVSSLLSQDGAYAWLRQYEPDARVGGSIYVYDFRKGRSPVKMQKPFR